MTRRAAHTGWLLLLLVIPAAASAQGRTCDLVQPTDYRQIVNARGDEVVYFRGPVRLECDGGIRLASDSAVYNRGQLQIELIGDVAYRDSTRQLTSEWANYIGQLEQLIARGDVVVTDLMDGSVLTGEEMEYLRETPERPTSRVIMREGRPRAVLREGEPLPRQEGPALMVPRPPADTTPPVEITADRLESYGDSLFRALGAVDIVRGGMTGASDSATYRRVAEHLALFGGAHVQDEQYRLEGEQIDAFVAGEDLEEVIADRSARLVSEDLTVRAARLRIGFLDGEVERMEAWNPPLIETEAAEPAGEAPGRAVATSEGFEMRADSIDARAARGQLREIRAVRRAYGERPLELGVTGLPAVAARDWIQGDTIIGFFRTDTLTGSAMDAGDPTDAVLPEADSLAPTADSRLAGQSRDSTEVVLERVVVIGGEDPALSLYRMEQDQGDARVAINFMRARRIILHMTDGDVSTVEAEGPLEGLHLDPAAGEPDDPEEAGDPANAEDPDDSVPAGLPPVGGEL